MAEYQFCLDQQACTRDGKDMENYPGSWYVHNLANRVLCSNGYRDTESVGYAVVSLGAVPAATLNQVKANVEGMTGFPLTVRKI